MQLTTEQIKKLVDSTENTRKLKQTLVDVVAVKGNFSLLDFSTWKDCRGFQSYCVCLDISSKRQIAEAAQETLDYFKSLKD
jgi:hypothetical protein